VNGISSTTAIRAGDALSVHPEATSIRAAAEQFEAFLLEQLLRPITESPFGPTALDGGAGSRLARERFVAQLARSAAEAGSLGIASLLEGASDSEAPAAMTPEGVRR